MRNHAWYYVLVLFAFSVWSPNACAQFLKLGPFVFTTSLENSWNLSSNVNGITKEEAKERGLDREDFWTTYGVSIGAALCIYPDIDLSLSSTVSWEEHFIQERPPSDPNIPFLGNSAFSLSRSLGHTTWSMNLNHSGNTSSDKSEVPIFVPGDQLLVRDILQTTSAGTTLAWSRRAFNANLNYTWNQSLHSEEFEAGNSRSQTISTGFGFTPWRRFSVNYNFSTSQSDLPDADPPVSGDWLDSQSLSATYRILERPQLSYTAGFEKEDDRILLGTWEPNHSWNFSDSRSVTETITYSVNASYTLDPNPEEDDISFLYGGNLNHSVTRNVNHSVNVSRAPVETFGSTVTTDSTSVGYNMSISSPFIRGATASLGATYSRNEPRGEVAGPVEERTDYNASLSKSAPLPLSRKLTGNVNYTYQWNNQQSRDPYDSHALSLTLSYQL